MPSPPFFLLRVFFSPQNAYFSLSPYFFFSLPCVLFEEEEISRLCNTVPLISSDFPFFPLLSPLYWFLLFPLSFFSAKKYVQPRRMHFLFFCLGRVFCGIVLLLFFLFFFPVFPLFLSPLLSPFFVKTSEIERS